MVCTVHESHGPMLVQEDIVEDDQTMDSKQAKKQYIAVNGYFNNTVASREDWCSLSTADPVM